MKENTEKNQQNQNLENISTLAWSKPHLVQLTTQSTEGKVNSAGETAGTFFGPS